jgi:hypothetical protein
MNSTIDTPPPTQSVQSEQSGPPHNGVFVKLQIQLLFGTGAGAIILGNLFSKAIGQALEAKELLWIEPPSEQNKFNLTPLAEFVTRGTTTLGFAHVTQLKPALETVRDELARLDALPFAEIGYLDRGTGKWVGWQPPQCESDFQKNKDLLDQWFDDAL